MQMTRVSSEACTVRKSQKLKTNTSENEDPFFEQIKYILYVKRLLGRLPFERTKCGNFRLRLCSPAVVYSLLMNAVQIYLTYLVYDAKLNVLFSKNGSYDNAIKVALMLLILNVHFYAWFIALLETGSTAIYLSHWQQFNKKYNYILNEQQSLKRLVLWLVLFLFVLVATLVIAETQHLLHGLQWYLTLPYFTVALHFILNSLHSYINCIIFIRVATELNEQLVKVFKNNPGFEDILSVRCMWQELNSLVKDYQRSNGNSLFIYLTISFIGFALTAYGSLTALFEKSTYSLGTYLIPLVFFLMNTYVCCDGPHRLHSKLGFEVTYTLLSCETTHMRKEAQQEIEMLVEIIEADPPVITIKGFFLLNRHLFTMAISTAVTYLVVLIQFKISSMTD